MAGKPRAKAVRKDASDSVDITSKVAKPLAKKTAHEQHERNPQTTSPRRSTRARRKPERLAECIVQREPTKKKRSASNGEGNGKLAETQHTSSPRIQSQASPSAGRRHLELSSQARRPDVPDTPDDHPPGSAGRALLESSLQARRPDVPDTPGDHQSDWNQDPAHVAPTTIPQILHREATFDQDPVERDCSHPSVSIEPSESGEGSVGKPDAYVAAFLQYQEREIAKYNATFGKDIRPSIDERRKAFQEWIKSVRKMALPQIEGTVALQMPRDHPADELPLSTHRDEERPRTRPADAIASMSEYRQLNEHLKAHDSLTVQTLQNYRIQIQLETSVTLVLEDATRMIHTGEEPSSLRDDPRLGGILRYTVSTQNLGAYSRTCYDKDQTSINMCNEIFGSVNIRFEGLRSHLDGLWDAAVPPEQICPSEKFLPIPTPILTVGYDLELFTYSQRAKMAAAPMSPRANKKLAVPISSCEYLLFPFFVLGDPRGIEAWSHDRASYHLAIAGACAMNSLRELSRVGVVLESAVPGKVLFFSVSMDSSLAKLNAHWIYERYSTDNFGMTTIATYRMNMESDLKDYLRALDGIFKYACGERLTMLRKALDEFVVPLAETGSGSAPLTQQQDTNKRKASSDEAGPSGREVKASRGD